MPVWLTYALLTASFGAFAFGLYLSGSGGRGRLRRLARYSGYLQVAALVAAYLTLRPGTGDDGRRDIVAASGAEQPIFVDVYSNF